MRQEMSSDGWRARVGIVVPSVNTVMEPWASRAAPAGVSVHFSRMHIPPETNAETLIEMDRSEGQLALRQLASAKPSVIAYGCTASSIVQGVDYDVELRQEITRTYGGPATTAAHAITTAVARFGGKSVSIVSPYAADLDRAEHDYFTDAGLDVLGGAFLGISDGFELASPEPKTLFELGLRGCDSKSDVLIMSCLNTRSHSVISDLENALGKPVVTSTQATLWHALRLAGIDDEIPGLGRLLVEH